MEYCQTKFRFRVNRILIFIAVVIAFAIPSTVWGGGTNDSEFFDSYSLSEREKCEIQKSWLNEENTKCAGGQYFQPIRSLKVDNTKKEQEIFLSSKKDDDWPLVNIALKAEMKSGYLIVSSLSINGFGYDLAEYLYADQMEYETIEIGRVGDAIVIQLKGQSTTQLSIISKYCDNGEVAYVVSQAFSWYPPMQGESYSKTFFKSPTCI